MKQLNRLVKTLETNFSIPISTEMDNHGTTFYLGEDKDRIDMAKLTYLSNAEHPFYEQKHKSPDLWKDIFEIIFSEIEEMLQERFPNSKFTPSEEYGVINVESDGGSQEMSIFLKFENERYTAEVIKND